MIFFLGKHQIDLIVIHDDLNMPTLVVVLVTDCSGKELQFSMSLIEEQKIYSNRIFGNVSTNLTSVAYMCVAATVQHLFDAAS